MANFRDLTAYQKAYKLAMEIFKISKDFPKEETYSLTDQVRRSSRSVCVNLGEGYRKRLYPKHFISKISDSDMENTETSIWLDFAKDCGYLNADFYKNLQNQNAEVGRLLGQMLKFPDRYGIKHSL